MNMPANEPSLPAMGNSESAMPLPDAGDPPWDLPEVSATIVDFRGVRAVVVGAAVILGGSLMMSTMVGIAAITGMLLRGASADTVVAELPGSQSLVLFAAAGGLLMSVAGGYFAATIAASSPIRHAVWASLLAALMSLLLLLILGDSGPAWLTTISIVMIVPCALLGGWLAMPIQIAGVAPCHRR